MIRKNKENVRNPGLRRSQAVSTFGPGAIVDLRRNSVMMGGQDFWPDEAVEIHEPHLERLLGVDGFKMPSTSGYSDLPALLFPEWLVCPKCHRLAHYAFFAQGQPVQTGREIHCPRCRVRVYPARLITACEHGHIDDFPWFLWVHIKSKKPMKDEQNRSAASPEPTAGEIVETDLCRKPELYLRARGVTSALSDLVITCKQCGASADLGGATIPTNVRFAHCRGRRLWLGDQVTCGMEVFPLQRGASNVYFPVQASSISIPPWSDRVHALLDRHWHTLRHISAIDTIADVATDLGLNRTLDMSIEAVVKAIRYRQMAEKREDETLTERDIRFLESQALHQGTGIVDPETEFEVVRTEVPDLLKGLISRVMLVHRLREVRALRGFTRVSPPDPASRLEVDLSPIARFHRDWLPAAEVRGEGIYLELDEEALVDWETDEMVPARADLLQKSYERMCHDRDWQVARSVTPRLLLVHSLAHLLIRQLGLESGYSSAALRERLYVFNDGDEASVGDSLAGLLIYTSTPDSEGSLGGLVRQGKPARLQETLIAALQETAWCSSDPLCIESQGQGRDALNLAACHACLLVSETSCEEFNILLDRGLLTGTLEHPEMGFFNRLVELDDQPHLS